MKKPKIANDFKVDGNGGKIMIRTVVYIKTMQEQTRCLDL